MFRHFRNFAAFHLVLLFISVNSAAGLASDGGIRLISAENPGGLLEIRDEKIIGAYPSFFHEASTRSGVSIDYRIVPWVRAVKETEQSDSLMLFPFTRTAARENRFTWITPLKEDPICFASGEAQINSLEEARKLKRVMVWRGTSQQAFLDRAGHL